MKAAPANNFQYIQDQRDTFLALFPHRFDYIYAGHPEPAEKPDWKTENRHPLSDRLIQQGGYLFGVRFGAQTNYCLLDLDIHSLYHPQQDPLAIARIVATLEPIGLLSYVACTSSYSNGIHLYFPFESSQNSWELASVVATLLTNAGFKLLPGQLELFPNPKPYVVEGEPGLFNAHRLPLQQGSYLLNRDFQPIWSDKQRFVQEWQLTKEHNSVDRITLKRIIKQAKRQCYRISGKADKFINDLNAEIETGWTDHGQTNRLLGRITMREYIFHHVLHGGEPLSGDALAAVVSEIASSLPGYTDWCRHQHEIRHRTREWADCIENSHYFHYGDAKGKYKQQGQLTVSEELAQAITNAPQANEIKAESAREKIRLAVADLLEQSRLPANATTRFNVLTKEYGIGGGTLYRYKFLWHPHYLTLETTPTNVASEIAPGNRHSSTSLLVEVDRNSTTGKGLGDRTESDSPSSVGNTALDQESEPFGVPKSVLADGRGIEIIQPPLFDLTAWVETSQVANQIARTEAIRITQEAQQPTYVEQMQQYLESGDPILVAEALAWAAINPGVLDLDRLYLSLQRSENKAVGQRRIKQM